MARLWWMSLRWWLLDRRTDKMIAVGDKAKMMHEKTHENIRTIRPLRDGVIADFYACEQMIRGLDQDGE